MDRITAIKSFVEVAHLSSFTKAAEKLGLSRLQVSRHVQELEQWLKQRLLHRTTRKVSLTQQGERALIRFERILDEASALIAQSYQDKTELAGTIRITSPIGFSQTMLIEAVSQFIAQHKGVKIDIHASDSFSNLVEERIDIALRYTNTPDESLIARPLMKIGACLCASPQYLTEQSEPMTPTDLLNHNCLVHLANDTWQLVRGDEVHEVKVSGSLVCNDVTTIVAAAINGSGVALLPYDIARKYIKENVLVPVLGNYHINSSQLWAVYLSRSYQLPVVRAFIDFIADMWQDDIEPAIYTEDTARTHSNSS
ncbi:LysR family transcriptional regulator [Pseudoalteromonas luteoviolacea]|uniref:LysR family transcriptional regulator n=1 Tax=Pseudoalteromonas luteoviolacea TaxID=43657 RepID=UPI001B375DCB|nr:LysR family transcriptional regulator [Pseudoalteromonas luteoviolacea]MBQ4810921.1 LysR family transcriptional regulator [Pseudoalteromonas luteoviolacea]